MRVIEGDLHEVAKQLRILNTNRTLPNSLVISFGADTFVSVVGWEVAGRPVRVNVPTISSRMGEGEVARRLRDGLRAGEFISIHHESGEKGGPTYVFWRVTLGVRYGRVVYRYPEAF